MRLGTRGSALALAQARWVAEQLPDEPQIVTVTTEGDLDRARGDKSRWTSALERALQAGEIDLAVHSAKDVPSELAEGLTLIAIPRRGSACDALCGAGSLDQLAAGARIGTSSLRRAAQLRALREDIEIVELRGNVDTRLRKLADGQCDALVLAQAGLDRLGRTDAAGAQLSELVPAAGQGALAVEGRIGDQAAGLDVLRDRDATRCVGAERELVAALGASCHTPVGAYATVADDGELELRAWVGLPDGSRWISDCVRGPDDGLGQAVAERMLAAGAGEILARLVAA